MLPSHNLIPLHENLALCKVVFTRTPTHESHPLPLAASSLQVAVPKPPPCSGSPRPPPPPPAGAGEMSVRLVPSRVAAGAGRRVWPRTRPPSPPFPPPAASGRGEITPAKYCGGKSDGHGYRLAPIRSYFDTSPTHLRLNSDLTPTKFFCHIKKSSYLCTELLTTKTQKSWAKFLMAS